MRVLSPTSKSHVWGSGTGRKPLEHLALMASGACAQELHRTGGNRNPILKRRTWTFMCTGSQGRARSPQESRSNLTAVLGAHPGKTGVNVACCEGRTLKAKLSGIFSSMPFSGGGHFGKIWHHPSVPTEKPQGSKQQSRWDHSPAPQSTGYLKTPQAHSCL